jgi:hypothetical protein
MLEILFELFGELILQLFGEILLELGLHTLAEPFRREPNVWLASIAYAAFGAAAGGLSLLFFSHYFTPAGLLRTANLFLTPVAVGLCMAGMGAWRARRNEPVFLLNKFLYGFIFAAGIATIRFRFAE